MSAKQSHKRKSGILLPMTALPSRFGVGDLGPEAWRFADFLRDAGQTLWQVLPLTATDPGCGNSPYSPTTAFAGSALLISPEAMTQSGLLEEGDLRDTPSYDLDRVDYDAVSAFKTRLFQKAWTRFKRRGPNPEFLAFCEREAEWLRGYSLFVTLKNSMNGKPWHDWPHELKFREPDALAEFEKEHKDEVMFQSFLQYLFALQMSALRGHLKELNIELVGDVPVYVTGDCADVWQHPELFDLDEDLNPVSVAGVPPDYFSATGQLWGNPLYNWKAMKRRGFHWWVSRLRHLLSFFDHVRIDHFRGLVAYWALPAGAKTAEHGEWRDVPYQDFFGKLREAFPNMPLWAENLGIITPDVEELRVSLGLPGMLILQFAFGNPWENPYAPHNHTPVNVVYTGTHDNNTTRGWWLEDASEAEKKNLSAYLGHEATEEGVALDLARMALSSVAEIAVVPMQDWLNLGAEGRFNVPSTPSGNWAWRLRPHLAGPDLAREIRELTFLYGRSMAE
ncbi:MAG: 4-alpha-glucanotransferase [Synergistaceae bacterium]|nr:4-alpha-glucanotransferase [Synergistaceae bacterium]